jgi:hypothetical protein
MTIRNIIISISLVFAITGCAVNKEWGTSGGSKADGIVKLSYAFGAFESPQLDDKKGMEKAIKTCKVWGYNSAEAFEFVNRRCQSTDFYGNCNGTIVTQEFQCTN